MHFKFRYSLLTLLILTALVAGGVKLWYGPHHVVKHFTDDDEIEYTFTRDWHGNKVLHGPVVQRSKPPGTTKFVNCGVTYFRNGQQLHWRYDCYLVADEDYDFYETKIINFTECPLSPAELEEFNKAIEELRKYHSQLPPHTKLVERQEPAEFLIEQDFDY